MLVKVFVHIHAFGLLLCLIIKIRLSNELNCVGLPHFFTQGQRPENLIFRMLYFNKTMDEVSLEFHCNNKENIVNITIIIPFATLM